MSNKTAEKIQLKEKKKSATKATSRININDKLDQDSINSVCPKKQSTKKEEEPPNHTFEIDKNIPMQWKVRVKKEAGPLNSESSSCYKKSGLNVYNVKPKRTNGYITEVPQKTSKAVTDKSLSGAKEKSGKLLLDNSHNSNSRLLKPPSFPLNNALSRKVYTYPNYEVGCKQPHQEQKNCKPEDGDTVGRYRSHWTYYDIGSASKMRVDSEIQKIENVPVTKKYLSPHYRPKVFQTKAPVQKRLEKKLEISSKKLLLSHSNTHPLIGSQQVKQNKEKYTEGNEGNTRNDKVQKYITQNGYVVRNSKAVHNDATVSLGNKTNTRLTFSENVLKESDNQGNVKVYK